MTYSALSTLLILGDDFARVDRAGIVAMLRGLQQPSGSYGPGPQRPRLSLWPVLTSSPRSAHSPRSPRLVARNRFAVVAGDSESDIRFVFTACAVSHMLNDWSGVDRARTVEFVRACQGYDFGIGQEPGLESHCTSIGGRAGRRACGLTRAGRVCERTPR